VKKSSKIQGEQDEHYFFGKCILFVIAKTNMCGMICTDM